MIRRKPKNLPSGLEAVRREKRGIEYWVIRVRYRDAGGARRSRTFDTVDDAKDFAASTRRAARLGELADLDRGSTTVRSFVVEHYWPKVALGLTVGTQRRYRSLYERYVEPELGDLPLRVIDVPRALDFAEHLERIGCPAQSRRQTLMLLQAVFKYAVLRGETRFNPVGSVPKPGVHRPDVHPLAPAAVERIRSAALEAGDPFSAALISVLAYAGLRPAEALGLRWRDVGKRTLTIERTATETGDVKQGTKVRSKPRRSVDLLDALAGDLETWRAASPFPPFGEAYVFPRGARPLTYVRKRSRDRATGPLDSRRDFEAWRANRWATYLEAAGEPYVRPYALRHSYASLRLAEGRLSLHELAEQMGHGVTMLTETYGHVIAEFRGRSVDADLEIALARFGPATSDAAAEDAG